MTATRDRGAVRRLCRGRPAAASRRWWDRCGWRLSRWPGAPRQRAALPRDGGLSVCCTQRSAYPGLVPRRAWWPRYAPRRHPDRPCTGRGHDASPPRPVGSWLRRMPSAPLPHPSPGPARHRRSPPPGRQPGQRGVVLLRRPVGRSDRSAAPPGGSGAFVRVERRRDGRVGGGGPRRHGGGVDAHAARPPVVGQRCHTTCASSRATGHGRGGQPVLVHVTRHHSSRHRRHPGRAPSPARTGRARGRAGHGVGPTGARSRPGRLTPQLRRGELAVVHHRAVLHHRAVGRAPRPAPARTRRCPRARGPLGSPRAGAAGTTGTAGSRLAAVPPVRTTAAATHRAGVVSRDTGVHRLQGDEHSPPASVNDAASTSRSTSGRAGPGRPTVRYRPRHPDRAGDEPVHLG